MNELSTTNQIIYHHHEAQAHAQNAVDHAIQAGWLLAQVKASTEHGQWIPLLESLGISARQAQRYMQVHRHREQLANTSRVSHLSLRDALRETSKPKARTPLLALPRERIAEYARWTNLQWAITFLLYADGWDVDRIVERTGFDPVEVASTINPRFVDADMYAHSLVKFWMENALATALRLADDEGMAHTKPILKVMQRLQADARHTVDLVPGVDNAVAHARFAVGLANSPVPDGDGLR